MTFYPLILTPDDNGTLLVTSEALPELTSFGETVEEALQQAGAAVLEALAARIAAGQPIPKRRITRVAGQMVAAVPYGAEVKIQLYEALRASKTTRAELSRKLNWHREQVDRLFRLDHASRHDQIEAAFNALGCELRFGFVRPKKAA
jgi:antitoxin HicB